MKVLPRISGVFLLKGRDLKSEFQEAVWGSLIHNRYTSSGAG
jgi:hypothetical protein